MKITDEEWWEFQRMPDPGPYSHRAWVDARIKERMEEVLTSALHPEFGTEWRKPDGLIYKVVKSAKVEVWEEGYDAGEADERRISACNRRGGPVSDCDCGTRTRNPYEDD